MKEKSRLEIWKEELNNFEVQFDWNALEEELLEDKRYFYVGMIYDDIAIVDIEEYKVIKSVVIDNKIQWNIEPLLDVKCCGLLNEYFTGLVNYMIDSDEEEMRVSLEELNGDFHYENLELITDELFWSEAESDGNMEILDFAVRNILERMDIDGVWSYCIDSDTIVIKKGEEKFFTEKTLDDGTEFLMVKNGEEIEVYGRKIKMDWIYLTTEQQTPSVSTLYILAKSVEEFEMEK